MPDLQLTGSAKQVEWAARIRSEMAARDLVLPDISDARFWIDNRDCRNSEALARMARAYWADFASTFESPFTDAFPRYRREEARGALEGLQRLAATVGVVVLDLETTGLEKTDHVVEIAAVRWPSRDIVEHELIRPPEGLTLPEVSPFDPGDLVLAPGFDEIAVRIALWAGEHHLVTWNVRFDAPFLRREIAHAGLSAPAIRGTCAMRLAAAWLEVDGWPSLEEAAGRLGVAVAEPAHRAMPDVITTCNVLDAMAGGQP